MNMAEETLDPALLRPGRFDRKLTISRPNLQEREEIFKYYAKKIRIDPSIDLGRLKGLEIAYRSDVRGPVDMQVGTAYGGQNVYWNEPDGHQWEMLTVSYARQP